MRNVVAEKWSLSCNVLEGEWYTSSLVLVLVVVKSKRGDEVPAGDALS